MTDWTALVPLRLDDRTKSRLAGSYDDRSRTALAISMARHVLDQLDRCPEIARIVLLASAAPEWWAGELAHDAGRGLNGELSVWRLAHPDAALLVIHADLPLLAADDIAPLLAASEVPGYAMAPDRLGLGTNALALAPGKSPEFSFGTDSRAAFRRACPDIAEVMGRGLAHDLDTPEDLAILHQLGWRGDACLARS